jgi:hypothetical protein
VLYEYVCLTDNPDIINKCILENKKKLDFSDNSLLMGRTRLIKEELSILLVQFINIEINNKKILDLSYLSMSKDIYLSKNLEKNKILHYFDNLNDDERNVEKIQQKYKIDKYNIGQQKTLYKYDKHGNNVETFLDLIPDAIQKENNEDEIDEENDDETDDDDSIENIIDDLDENYHDGTYYDEDKDNDDFNNN